MMKIRRPAVAGYFYPADRGRLDETVTSLLDAATYEALESEPGRHKAVVAPHAGYIYSGPVAATAYRWLAERGGPSDAGAASLSEAGPGEPEAEPGGAEAGQGGPQAAVTAETPRGGVARVVVIGPSHQVPFRGLAVSGAEAFESPLGLVPVDRESVERVLSLSCVQERDDAHELEHSVEVHLPFLQRTFPVFRLVPLVASDAEPADVESALRLLWGGPETSIVVSSDLSHYLDYDSARRRDRETAQAIEALRFQDICPTRACGAVAVQGLLGLAAERGLRVRTLDLRNSGDTAGPKDRVVGYGAFAFEEAVS